MKSTFPLVIIKISLALFKIFMLDPAWPFFIIWPRPSFRDTKKRDFEKAISSTNYLKMDAPGILGLGRYSGTESKVLMACDQKLWSHLFFQGKKINMWTCLRLKLSFMELTFSEALNINKHCWPIRKMKSPVTTAVQSEDGLIEWN